MNAAFELNRDASPHGLRQAALLLHGVVPADRDWMLGQLEEAPRLALLALLGELQSLGVPVAASLVQEVLRTSAGDGAAPSADTEPQQQLAGASPRALHRALGHEPDALIARVLSLLDSRARVAVLTRFALPRRRILSRMITEADARADASSGAHLDRALCHALLTRIDAVQQRRHRWAAAPLTEVGARIAVAARRWRDRAAARRSTRRPV